jgi:U4/U6 small nuclear ribonucleoprotein PRP3
MSGKRPLDPENGVSGDSKRIRSNNGSPAPPPSVPAPQNGEPDIERKKREAAERMAAVKARLAATKAGSGPPTAPPVSAAPPPPPAPATNGAAANDVEAKRAEAQKKIAEMRARMAAKKGDGGNSTASPVNGGVAAAPPPQSDRELRIAEARARAAELSKQRAQGAGTPLSVPAAPPPRQDGRGARGGLGIGLHPSLMGDSTSSAPNRGKAGQGPKFSTTKGNQQPAKPALNPYMPDDSEEQAPQHDPSIYDPTISSRRGGDRKSKQLIFNQKGKFMAQANALRQQAKLEDMKRRIAAETRKVEIEEASDKAFLVPAPPDVEWWDEGLLPESQHSYDNCLEDGRNKIATSDSIITALVQHPVMLAPPQDKFIPAAKPLMLTQHEQKKLRRQRRMADMKEEQAKIRLGLIEPPPPKVKKSNMMRVLGEQAVKDPTAVEARVNREIAQRAADHSRANEDRKLTKEEREEKLKRQQAGDEAKGLRVAVFRVDDLSSGKHRYQVDVNAKDHALTGVVVLHPEMNLVIVEGGQHSMEKFKKLMLNRIKWGDNTLPLNNSNPTTFTGAQGAQQSSSGTVGAGDGMAGTSKAATWVTPWNEEGELKDLSENRCLLVWEGEQLQRSFKRWGSRVAETDGEARDLLSRQKMENMWTLARSK